MTSASPSHPEPFRCEVRAAGAGVVSLAPAGELDGATVEEVARALRDARAQALAVLVLDLRGLTFMDSAGLHLILDTEAWARRAGVRVVIVPGPQAVRRIFEVTGADSRLQFVDRPPEDGRGRNGSGPDPAAQHSSASAG